MKVDIIKSGSSGNCAIIDDTIIIDAGSKDIPAGRLVLLTHAHTDHTKHLHETGGLPVWATSDTIQRLEAKFPFIPMSEIKPNVITYYAAEQFVTYGIIPREVEHDIPCVAYEIIKYVNDVDQCRIFFGTDFSAIREEYWFIKSLERKTYDALYIECNNTLYPTDFLDIYFPEIEGNVPKDEFHRRRSYNNHCNAQYLIGMFRAAGYSESNRFTEPVTLLHKSSYYYHQHDERIVELCKIANIINPLF